VTKSELIELIQNGENSGVEFKRDTIDNRSLARELVAFANFDGGRVLLGVDDDATIRGVTRPDLEEWVMTACRDKIRPEIIPYFEMIRDVEPGRHVAVVQVDAGWTAHLCFASLRTSVATVTRSSCGTGHGGTANGSVKCTNTPP